MIDNLNQYLLPAHREAGLHLREQWKTIILYGPEGNYIDSWPVQLSVVEWIQKSATSYLETRKAVTIGRAN